MPRYFTLKELCSSETATKKNIDNYPTFVIVEHLKELSEKILDPLRKAWGGAIIVTSGYRSTELNKAVGGVISSVHRLGWAADLQPANGKTEDFIKFAKTWSLINRVKFDQFIRETTADKKTVWLHIGLYSPKGEQRNQYLDIVKK